eukprot:TRINITY_DN121422_c0_g1_i1.p1 TRINITY_DN121422_c0_g1~~TRINITY_DN121422_c0_g1_i1.p1  ORF type:complete len:453 (+),score=97.28 TRINITY_DN121422_c0_g1_i1:103-1359(+)
MASPTSSWHSETMKFACRYEGTTVDSAMPDMADLESVSGSEKEDSNVAASSHLQNVVKQVMNKLPQAISAVIDAAAEESSVGRKHLRKSVLKHFRDTAATRKKTLTSELTRSGVAHIHQQERMEESWRQDLKRSTDIRDGLAESLKKAEEREVQWAAAIAELKQSHKAQLEEQLKALREQLDVVQRERDQAQARLQRAAAAAAEPGKGGLAPIISQILGAGCPSRRRSSASASGAVPTYCQATCWATVEAIPGVVALLCAFPGLEVLEVSRSSLGFFKRSVTGMPLTGLLAEAQRAQWLRKAVLAHHELAQLELDPTKPVGLGAHKLGAIAFTDGRDTFTGELTTLHLPEEPALNKQPAILVVIESQSVTRHNMPGPFMQMKLAGGFRKNSQVDADSDVSASDIDPSDSASQIAPRGG